MKARTAVSEQSMTLVNRLIVTTATVAIAIAVSAVTLIG